MINQLMSFEALTPTAYLRRSALVFADKTAVIDGNQRWTYAQLLDRCTRLAMIGTAYPMKVSDALLSTSRERPRAAMAMVMPRAFSSGALSMLSNSRNEAVPVFDSTSVIADVSVVFPWST